MFPLERRAESLASPRGNPACRGTFGPLRASQQAARARRGRRGLLAMCTPLWSVPAAQRAHFLSGSREASAWFQGHPKGFRFCCQARPGPALHPREMLSPKQAIWPGAADGRPGGDELRPEKETEGCPRRGGGDLWALLDRVPRRHVCFLPWMQLRDHRRVGQHPFTMRAKVPEAVLYSTLN